MFCAHQGRCRRRPRGSAGGGPALRVPAPPRPAGRRCQPPAASVGGRRGWEAGSARRAARPPPGPARRAPRPARRARGMARGAARPPRPSPLAVAVPLCPSPLRRRASRAGRGGGDRGGGGGGMRYGWPAARHGIRPAAGRGPGLACWLSIAIDSVVLNLCNPAFDQIHCVICRICRIYKEIC
jgi:hypothetical protein